MIDHDRLFKELLKTFFLDFLDLFAPEMAALIDAESVEFLDKEVFADAVTGDRYEADLVVKVRLRGETAYVIFHIEHQAQHEADFVERMFWYFALFHHRHRTPVYPIAILSYATPRAEQPNVHRVAFPNREVLRFEYHAIQLNRLNWRDFVRRENPVAAALMAKMDIAKEDRPRVKLECLRLLATLKLDRARMSFISAFVDTYLKLSPTEEAKFETELAELVPQEKEEVMELTTSWMERGIEQGLQQGLQQGLLRGREEGLHQGLERERELALRFLTRKVGPVTPEIELRVRTLTHERLEALADALLDFATPDDLTRWLDQTE
jgi:predicted transposase YdaD